MKQIVPLIMIILFSQMGISQQNDDSYEVLWSQVRQLESEALTKSALDLVKSISEKAKKEKNSAQMVKALLYASKYALTLEEDAQLKIVTDFRSEIEKADFPTKNILESYLAHMYWQYFQTNRYQFYDRTKTEVKVDAVDFRTWDLNTLFEEINHHFEASLANREQLQTILVSQFDELLYKQPNSENYRPTLFDLLAHTALEFYGTDENSITRPADKFVIDDPEILCEADTFIALKIDTTDATSLQSKALEIYQQLLRQHRNTSLPYLLAEVDIQRLHFIYRNATFENKEERFLEVLQNSAHTTAGSSASTLYTYEIAALLSQQGDGYRPKVSELQRWKKKKALELCESVIASAPNSRGADKCLALKSALLATSLQLTTEQFLPNDKTSRLLVDYKNVSQLQFSARKVTDKQLLQLNELYPEEKIRAFIEKLPVVKEWNVELKNENDHQNHRTEVTMPPLGNNQYIIFTFPKNTEDKSFAYSAVQVTDMALTETRSPTEHTFQVIDRLNGKPIAGADVKLTYLKNYNRPYVSKSFETDKMGMVAISLKNEYWSDVSVRVTKSGETAHFGQFQINERYNNSANQSSGSCFLFTDRSIYRPGQPLYFKGIAVKTANGISSILENTQITVDLLDVNYQVVGSQQLVTNGYGSFSGEFIVPNSGLTGNFTLRANSTQAGLNGSTSFSVEEYKRPKFETFFDPIKESYKVNDSITVQGRAIAYAGSTISDAKVSYRVSRVVYFPRWYYWYHPYLNHTPQEIAHGETLSDASGSFEIDFKALPDTSASKEGMPTFQYLVTADVTDINGETHSTSTTVTVGYHTMRANMYLADPLDKDKKDNKLTISTTNLNGMAVGAKGSVKMYKLEAPEQVLRPRPWASPDYEGFTKSEFKKLFPHDAFGNEHDPKNWEKGELVWQANFDTAKATEIAFGQMKKWLSGIYILELETEDKFGMPVKDVTQISLFSTSDTTLADNQLFEIKTDKASYAIGDKAKITLLSAATDLHVTVHVEKGGKVVDRRLIRLDNGAASFTLPINEDDLGGFGIGYSFSAYNAFQSGNLTIAVPYPVTDLQIETVTFRDKLAPGTDETWSFKIKGAKGDKVSAELLASMYDSSLDAFRGHYWSFYPKPLTYYYSQRYTNAYQSYGTRAFNTYLDHDGYYAKEPYFDSFDWFGLYFGYVGSSYGYSGRMKKSGGAPEVSPSMMMDDMELEGSAAEMLEGKAAGLSTASNAPKEKDAGNTVSDSLQVGGDRNENGGSGEGEVQIRKNLQETAFFFPQLQTDAEGNVSFSFTTPEALTRWRLQLLAHTKSLESTVLNLEAVTQKELMVLPNAPRFLREGDEIEIRTKIANLTAKPLSGEAKLTLVDAVTGENISKLLLAASGPADGKVLAGQKRFAVDSMGNGQVSWRLKIPEGLQAVQYTVSAKAGDFSDGEQNLLPVLTNRMLVTETLPMWVRSNQTKIFSLDKLGQNTSPSLKHHKLTLEMTSNPAWYAVQALPYLMEYPYDCNEQTFSRYYSNALASHIANNNPRIQEVFDQWANSDALLSNLEKNAELKSLLIQETPWLRDAQSETEQKKRVALLFNLNKMKNERAIALNKLKQNQKPNGAWPWFNGGPANRYITQHIVTGLGHLAHLSVQSGDGELTEMTQNAIAYLDDEFVREYEEMKKYASNLNDDHLSQMQIHYLYMRSFFKDVKTSKKVDGIIAYYKGQAQNYWMQRGLYPKGMLALVLHRMDDAKTANKILKALEENSITSEELGMYWKSNTPSWYWYQAPIETQALLIEAFSEIHPADTKTVDDLKIWLLKNKQTNQWSTTKATTEAVYALLLQGSDWLSVTDAVDVLVGGKKIDPSKLENVKVEAGTGYYKTSWSGPEIAPEMAEVQLSKKGDGIAWGALYWQYFEDLDKITSAETPLKLKKKLFLKKNTDTGEEISEITEKTDLKVGDLVRVRIELRTDRDMEFVHMKDMRAAGFEPINVISHYKWQDGLGYYESTKDASTNFFFDYLPKGVYVFEYDLRANNAGEFSNGITTIQSMYAPEFSSHSEGVRVSVGGQ